MSDTTPSLNPEEQTQQILTQRLEQLESMVEQLTFTCEGLYRENVRLRQRHSQWMQQKSEVFRIVNSVIKRLKALVK